MIRQRFLWMMILLFLTTCPALFADVHISPNGVVGTGTQGGIHVTQDLYNDGQFVYASSHIRFFGEGVSNVLGRSGLYVRRLVLDKNTDGFLYLMEPVGVGDSLLLLSGAMDFAGGVRQTEPVISNAGRRDTDMVRKEVAATFEQSQTRKKTSRKELQKTGIAESVFTLEGSEREDERQPLIITERDGSLILGDQATIRLQGGSLLQSPGLNGDYNLIYRCPQTTGAELISCVNALQKMTLEMTSGTLILNKNAWVNQSLTLGTANLDTDEYTLTMGETAPIIGHPDNIVGDYTGTAIEVNTGSYINSTFLVYISAGTSIGNFYPLLFTEPDMIGPSGSVERQWFVESDAAPYGRNMQFGWLITEDNGLDLSSVQLWRSDDRSQWMSFGHPLDMSGSGNLRVITAYNVSELGWWTIGQALFDISEYTIDMGEIPVGETTATSFTITNLTDSYQYGYVFTPDWITAEYTSRSRAAAGREQPLNIERDETIDRSYAYYSVDASGTTGITLQCKPQSQGEFAESIQIRLSSNNFPTRVLTLTGTGVMPDIEVSPTTMDETLAQDETTTAPLTIRNVGLQQLDYSIECGTVLLSTTFDGTFPPTGWSRQTLSGSRAWSRSSTIGHTDTYSAYASRSSVYDSRLITPYITISSATVLSYWIRTQYPPTYGGMFDVEITTDGSHWTSIDSYSQNTLSQVFEQKTLDLSPWSGSTVRLAFRASENYMGDGVFLDDVLVKDTAPVSWLSVVESAGSIPAESYLDVDIQLDASGLSDGTYDAGLLITSNDPLEPLVSVPVTLNVQTAACHLSVSDIEFGTIVLGEDSFGFFTINNTGNAPLEGSISAPDTYNIVTSHRRTDSARKETLQLTNANDDPIRETVNFSITAGGSLSYSITFTPEAIGQYEDILTITHNAPGSPDHITLLSDVITTPTVTTIAVTDIEYTTAVVVGNVSATGGAEVSSRGVCWDTQHHPTLDDSYTTEGSGTGAFTSTLTGLQPETHYYARAYAINAAGTNYGVQLDFYTLALGPPAAPQDVQISVTDTGIYLTWNEVIDADEYYIYRVDNPSITDWGEPIGSTSGTNWLDTAPLRDGMAYYRITAVRNVRTVNTESGGESVRK